MTAVPQPIDPSGDAGVIVRVGDREFSLREYQDLFAEITGGDSRLSRRFERPFIVRAEDLRLLYQKLYHHVSNYHPVGHTCKVVVSHRDDDLQEFKTFEAFLGYETSATSSVSGVTIEINFALVSPLDNKRTRAYKIRLFLNSQVSDLKELESERFEFGLVGPTVIASVDYYDYTVGVSCMAILEAWTRSLQTQEEGNIYRYTHKFQDILLVLFHLFFLTASSTLFFIAIGTWVVGSFEVPNQADNLRNTAIFAALIISVCLALHQGTYVITRKLRSSIEYLRAHSIIVLNKQDEMLAEWYHKKRKKSAVVQSVSFGSALLYAILVKFLVESLLHLQG